MKGLDQGHLHPKLEARDWHVSAGNRTRVSLEGGEHSTVAKSYSNSVILAIRNIFEQRNYSNSEHQKMSSRQVL